MNYSYFSTLCLTILLVRFKNSIEALEYDALIVRQKSLQLDQMELGDEQKKCESCLIACPSTDEESTFDHLDSITANSMFLRKFYGKPVSAKEMQLLCPKPSKPSMIFDINEKSYDVGYELYYEEGTTTLLYRNYRSLRKIIGTQINDAESGSSGLAKKNIDRFGKTTFKISDVNDKNQRTLVFSWIPVLSVQIDGHQRHIKFNSDVVNGYKTMDKCEKLIIGDEWVQNQVKKIVEKASPPRLTRGHSDSSCHRNESCLEKVQIVPMSFLHTNAAKLATCAHINLALIWEKIAKGQLEKVDRYLYAVLRRWYSSIKITFGVSGEFQLDESDLAGRQSEEIRDEISVENPLQKIPLPNVIYRIVEYLTEQRKYQVLIIIHNNRDEVKDADRICPENYEVSGWDRIKSDEGVKIGLSYACPVTKETIGKLGKYGAPTTQIPIPGVLKLNQFPQTVTDETQNIDKVYDKIFPKIQSKL